MVVEEINAEGAVGKLGDEGTHFEMCVEVDTAYDYKVWANVGTELATRERTWRKNLSMRCSQLL